MTVFGALLGDAWRRARDQKKLVVLVVLGLLVALFCASFEVGRPEPRASLAAHLARFDREGPRRGGPFATVLRRFAPDFKAPRVHVHEPRPEDDLPGGLQHCAVADVELTDPAGFDRYAAARADGGARDGEPRRDAVAELSPRARADVLVAHLTARGWETVIARPADDAGRNFVVITATDHLAELEGRFPVTALFGLVPFQDVTMSPAAFVVTVELGIADFFAGLVGMVIFLSAFGGTLPDLLQKGTLDLVLARPVSRARVLLCAYAGAVATVFLAALAIFGACGLALALRAGHLSFAFVGNALTATAVFAMLFPVVMLVGLLTRNETFATLAGVACWFIANGVTAARALLGNGGAPPWLQRALDVVYWIAPKTGDAANFGHALVAKGQLSPLASERFLADFPPLADPWFTAGTSLAFTAALLALVIALYRRRDF